jgi:hypothetical protein
MERNLWHRCSLPRIRRRLLQWNYRGSGPKRECQEQEWVARGALHAIHAVFPPPDIRQHDGGRDSISVKKLKKGDARWKPAEVLLGSTMSGRPGSGRTVAMSRDKRDN